MSFLLFSSQTFAQNHEGWYQIEVIIYKRAPLSDIELWPKDVALKYPSNWQALKDPNELAAVTPNTDIHEIVNADDSINVDKINLTVEPFYFLPKQDRILNKIASNISRRNNFRILFHEAWRQVVLSEKASPSVLIFGGDTFGEHSELEGSININVARYLHFNTNLWFSEFQVNTGQSRYDWSDLPQDPRKALALLTFDSENMTPSFNNATISSSTAIIPANSWSIDSITNELPNFLSSPYLPQHITTLKQSRRMRSNVLHFIDHPELGVVVKILHYEKPEKILEE